MTKRVIASVRMNGGDIAVEVLKVWRAGDGHRVAEVEALPVRGRKIQPFTHYSIGGPYQSNAANIRLQFLRGISRVDIQPEPEPEQTKAVVGIVRMNGADIPVEVKEVYTSAHGERIATVEALPVNGIKPAPFMNYSLSRGNPHTSTTRIPASEVIGLSLVNAEA